MRICHLFSPEFREGPPRGRVLHGALLSLRRVIERTPEHEHRVVLFGTQQVEDLALTLGIDTSERIPCPSQDPARGVAGLRRYLSARPPFDALTCWSEPSLLLWRKARWLQLDASGVVFGPPSTRASFAGVPIVACCAPDARAWDEVCDDVHLAMGETPHAEHRPLREALGLDADTLLIAQLEDPPASASAVWMAYLLLVLEYRGIPACALVPGQGGAWRRARAVMRQMGLKNPIVAIDDPPALVAPSCDVAVCGRAGDGPYPGAQAVLARHVLRSGVPVVGPANLLHLIDLPEFARDACIAPSARQIDIAPCLAGLGESRMLRRRLRTWLLEHTEGDQISLADTLGSIWAHAPARRRPHTSPDPAPVPSGP